MPRKEFAFRTEPTAVSYSLDPAEYKGCSVRAIEKELYALVRGNGHEPNPVDITVAAMELFGGN